MGGERSGKTTFGRHFMMDYLDDTREKSFVLSPDTYGISASGRNPMDSYVYGMRSFMLDDVNGDTALTRTDVLSLTDKAIIRDIGARYHVKDISFLELVVFTSILSPERYFNLFANKLDPVDQFLGRIDYIVKTDDRNKESDDYRYHFYKREFLKNINTSKFDKEDVLMFNNSEYIFVSIQKEDIYFWK